MATKITSLLQRPAMNYATTAKTVYSRVNSLQRHLMRYCDKYREDPTRESFEIIRVYSTELLRVKQKYSAYLTFTNHGSR